ncbi:MAG: helicase-exonuclease AddAB subunit AddA [Clostridiales bacterium]|nr:helicase-exonuclease AddAB subunit AddA [Clostridiales bacterium]
MRFTPQQSQAIESKNQELLVSAAAGSGKTAVLVERILHMIKEWDMSIDRMLVVTFTRAAASELRERLELRLVEAAQSNPALQKQADLVASAQISTIHSFCQKTIRQNFQHCQVDPQFTLSDDRTRIALYSESKEESLEQLYITAKEDSDVQSLVSKFSERDISNMMDLLYSFLMSRPHFLTWLWEHAAITWTEDTIDQSPMALAFCQEASLMIQGTLSLWQKAKDMANNPLFPQKYLRTIDSDGVMLAEVNDGCAEGFLPLLRALSAVSFDRIAIFKPTTDEEAQMAQSYKAYREQYKKLITDMKASLPSDTEQGIADIQSMRPASIGLAKAVEHFHRVFSARKHELGVLDFNDLEHMTLDILTDGDLKAEMGQLFDAVFVDEYQDVSELQESILNGLKRETTPEHPQYFFYVGDVKQSIYRFRLAQPSLFLGKQNSFSSDENAVQRKIVLNRNFRSKSDVLSTVNKVFEHVMDSRVTEIDYDEDAKLYPGAASTGDPTTEIHILNSEGIKSTDKVLAEAEMVARDILRTIGTPVVGGEGNECGVLHYRDIAVLMPATKNIADKVELVLAKHGIPVYTENSTDALGSDEVTQVIQHLRLLDNLMNDVALISEMRSPLFEMTESELAQIRLMKPEREASFLSAVIHASRSEENPKLAARCADVLSTLEHERFLFTSMSLDLYLWDFIMRSGLYIHYGAQQGGKQRQANLQMLCHKAGEYGKSHADGLHGFIEMLTLDASSGASISPTIINPWEDVVRIMTIHKSKGLEFPTVYVMGLGRKLTGKAATKSISIHGDIGFAVGYVNEHARTKRTTFMQSAIELKDKNEDRAERARVLYVAMTRPKSRLVLIGSISEKRASYEDILKKSMQSANTNNDVMAVRSASSMMEWVLQSVSSGDQIEEWEADEFSTEHVRETDIAGGFPTESTCFPHESADWRVVFHINPPFTRQFSRVDKNKFLIPTIAINENTADENIDISRYDDVSLITDPITPDIKLSHHPLKLGVTALCRAIEESGGMDIRYDAEDEVETSSAKRLPLLASKPRLLSSLPTLPPFMEPPKEEYALKKGTQTHKLLGLMDLDRAKNCNQDFSSYIMKELNAMVQSGQFTKEESEFVDKGMIAAFLRSDLGTRLLASPHVQREWSFNLKITSPLDTIVQGIIDLCFLEDGEWVLIDFKTDRISDMDTLWNRYALQLTFYRDALKLGTPYPIKEYALYSLRLGKKISKLS